jgi:hypothetical protein
MSSRKTCSLFLLLFCCSLKKKRKNELAAIQIAAKTFTGDLTRVIILIASERNSEEVKQTSTAAMLLCARKRTSLSQELIAVEWRNLLSIPAGRFIELWYNTICRPCAKNSNLTLAPS